MADFSSPLSTLVGKVRLKSDKELSDFINDLQSRKKENYYRRDSQPKTKLKSSNRTCANGDLNYYSVRYDCIHGQTRKSVSKGIR